MYLWDKISRLNTLIRELRKKQYNKASSTLYKIQKLSKKDSIKLLRGTYRYITKSAKKTEIAISKFYNSINVSSFVDDVKKIE